VRSALTWRPVEQVIATGLHDFIDRLQRDLILLAAEIGTAFFRDWRPLAGAQSQSQTSV
jgi:hypothetical protein